MTRKELILMRVRYLVSDFTHYDRLDDEALPRDHIEEAVEGCEITIDEIVAEFRSQLEDAVS